MNIRLAQASSSEYRSKWGEPGDQRKHVTERDGLVYVDGELSITDWVNNWTCVYRPIDREAGIKIADKAVEIVLNPNAGYSQNNGASPRTTLLDELLKNKWDVSKIGLCNCDCSSMVMALSWLVGYNFDRDMWTGSMDNEIMKSKKFKKLTDDIHVKQKEFLRKGDILWRSGHTAIVIDDGILDDYDTYKATGNVWIRSGAGTKYSIVDNKYVPNGKTVHVFKLVNGWVYGEYDGSIGYISTKYLTPIDVKMKVVNGNVWMRKGAGSSNEGILVIDGGNIVKWNGNKKLVLLTPWYQVEYAGKTGWCSGKYLEALIK